MSTEPHDAANPVGANEPIDTHDAEPDEIGAAFERRAERTEDQLRRTAADLDNLQKRFQRETIRERTAARESVLLRWVAMLDDLERALSYHADRSHQGDSADASAPLAEGVETITHNAVATIEALGYPRFGAPGEPFDPALHEVITTVPASDDAAANVIVAVATPGYGTPAALLRPASVVGAKEAE